MTYLLKKNVTRTNYGKSLVVLALLWAIANPLQAEEVRLQYRDLTVIGNLEIADGKTIEDGVVLILHGMMAHHRMEVIEASQQALLDNGSSSLAITVSLGIDKRHGFYDCNWPQRHTIDGALVELDVWVEWLISKRVKQIALLAHSRGANQAMVYAVEHRNPTVSHVVLLAPNSTANAKPQYEARYGEIFESNLARVKNLIDAGKGSELIKNIDFSYCPQASVSADTFYSYNRYDDKYRKFDIYLPKMPVPTLIIVGTQDELQPNIDTEVTPYVDGEHVQLVKIENAGHFFLDFNIEEAMEATVEFIGESE